MAPDQEPAFAVRLERIESKLESLVAAVIGGLDGKPGMLARLAAVEARQAEQDTELRALKTQAAAAAQTALSRWWEVAKIPLGVLLGAIVSQWFQHGGKH